MLIGIFLSQFLKPFLELWNIYRVVEDFEMLLPFSLDIADNNASVGSYNRASSTEKFYFGNAHSVSTNVRRVKTVSSK